jgi:2-oxoglutarate dehydrogenase E1 component
MMYQAIRQHPTARQLYAEQLRADGIVNAGEPEQMVEQYRNALDSGRLEMHQALGLVGNKYTVDWSRYAHTDFSEYPHTGVEPERLLALGQRVVQYPSDLVLHARVAQIITQRARMMSGEVPLDWGAAETLAYASLLEEGVAVRISGQDSARGTFFHRHAVLYDQKSRVLRSSTRCYPRRRCSDSNTAIPRPVRTAS